MKCVLCGEPWPGEKVPFSAVCEKCDCWLHSCIQCALWDSGAEMCRSMTTDSISDREGKNFCEEWKPAAGKPAANRDESASGKFDSLFGN